MTDQELLRILQFLRGLRSCYEETMPSAPADEYWNIGSFLIESHLRKMPMTITSLASVAGVPYTTARRRILKMIEDGEIIEIGRKERANSSLLEPSESFFAEFKEYAAGIKHTVVVTLGFKGTGDAKDVYFGRSDFAADVLPPPELLKKLNEAGSAVRILAHEDNYFRALKNVWSDYRLDLKNAPQFTFKKLPDLYADLERGLSGDEQGYDVVAITMPWLGGFAAAGSLKELDELTRATSLETSNFHPSIWSTGLWHNKLFGVPVFCTAEIFAVRTDLFCEADIAHPRTYDEVLSAGRSLQRPAQDLFGVSWNAAEGVPLGTSFLTFMASAGAPITRPLETNRYYQWDSIVDRQDPIFLNTEKALEVLDFMRRLLEVSPPNVLELDWQKRIEVFLQGHAAMTFCSSMRAAHFEFDPLSRVSRRVSYLAHPKGDGGRTINMMGGFVLGVPARLAPDRARLAMDVIAAMVAPTSSSISMNNEYPVAPRFSMSDQNSLRRTPIPGFLEKLERRGALHVWERSVRPKFFDVENISGLHVHAALRGDITDRQAIQRIRDGLGIDPV